MYKYNEDIHELEPYLYSTTKNIIYANSKAKAEYTNKPVADKPSWFSRLWNSLFSSDDADQNEKQKKKEEKVEQEVKAQKPLMTNLHGLVKCGIQCSLPTKRAMIKK